MKLSKNERLFLGFVWAVALSAIAFAHVKASKKEEGVKIIEYKSENADYIQSNPFLRVD
jgi:D-serine dehydratase